MSRPQTWLGISTREWLIKSDTPHIRAHRRRRPPQCLKLPEVARDRFDNLAARIHQTVRLTRLTSGHQPTHLRHRDGGTVISPGRLLLEGHSGQSVGQKPPMVATTHPT